MAENLLNAQLWHWGACGGLVVVLLVGSILASVAMTRRAEARAQSGS